jgi:hypothetical protein
VVCDAAGHRSRHRSNDSAQRQRKPDLFRPQPPRLQKRGQLSHGTGSIAAVAAGYAIAAILMLIAAAVELAFGVDAEQRSLESITEPLSLN